MTEDSFSQSKFSIHRRPDGNERLVTTLFKNDSELSSGTSITDASEKSDPTYRPSRNWAKTKFTSDVNSADINYDDETWGEVDSQPVPETTESTATTRRTTATIVSNCTMDPMANPDYLMRRENAKAELEGRLEMSPNLIDDFFGLDAVLQEIPPTRVFIAENHSNGRWKNIPGPKKVDEDLLNASFLKLLKDIRRYYRDSGTHFPTKRRFRDTHSSRVAVRGESDRSLRPDVSFCGAGRSLPEETPESSPFLIIPEWKWFLAPLEGKIHQSRTKDDRYQLASYVCEIFSAQDNRRFIPGGIFTQSILDFYLFDRSGFTLCDSFDYHAEPEKFMAIVYSLLTFDEERLGFDSSIVHENRQQYIATRVQDVGGSIQRVQRYIVDEKLWHSMALVGDCTICWRVKKEDVDDGYYIIKDSWVVGGSSNEGSLLERVSSKELNGLIPIVSHEDVITSTGDVDSISNIRPPRDDLDTTTPPEGRVHTRVVMRLDGKARPLEFFKDPAELLIALHDAIEGHRNLYEAGILCRDITPFNILIQPNALCGRRGILLNLHCAVGTETIPKLDNDEYIGSLLPASIPDTLGSRAFQSCRALKVIKDRHTNPNGVTRKLHYTDDLESFYYTLRYMASCFPGQNLIKPDPELRNWFTKFGVPTKYAEFIEEDPEFTVSKECGEPVRLLLQKLHAFLRPKATSTASSWRPEGVDDYDTVLGYFKDALVKISEKKQGDNSIAGKTDKIIPLAREADVSEILPGQPQAKRPKYDELSMADRIKCASRTRR